VIIFDCKIKEGDKQHPKLASITIFEELNKIVSSLFVILLFEISY